MMWRAGRNMITPPRAAPDGRGTCDASTTRPSSTAPRSSNGSPPTAEVTAAQISSATMTPSRPRPQGTRRVAAHTSTLGAQREPGMPAAAQAAAPTLATRVDPPRLALAAGAAHSTQTPLEPALDPVLHPTRCEDRARGAGFLPQLFLASCATLHRSITPRPGVFEQASPVTPVRARPPMALMEDTTHGREERLADL
jgi:hypothetical protein